LEAGIAIHPWSWIFFVSYVLIASFLVINILIAIIINSMEEVHQAEREALDEELDAEGDGSVAERLEEIRHALDKLELELVGNGEVDRASKRIVRPSKGGRMRA
jgi:voltage-gated sodium channel